jgi:hypothetical protein
MSGITYYLWPVLLVVHSPFQKYVRYNVEPGHKLHWCLKPFLTMCQISRITWWPVLLVFNATFNNMSVITYNLWPVLLVFSTTFNNMSGITYNMVISFIGSTHPFQTYARYYLVTFYWCLKPHLTMCQVSHITWWPVLLVFNAPFNNISSIMFNMVTSFIGV